MLPITAGQISSNMSILTQCPVLFHSFFFLFAFKPQTLTPTFYVFNPTDTVTELKSTNHPLKK